MNRLASLFVLLGLVVRGGAQAPAGTAAFPATAKVDAVAITVHDADRSVAFFTGVLGFRVVDDTEASSPENDRRLGVFAARTRVVRLSLGDEAVELVDFIGPEGRPWPAGSRSHDAWFQHLAIVVADIDLAWARVRAAKVETISPEPQRIPASNPAAGGIRAAYFRDPDGHPLELIHYPPGKGDPRWQRRGEDLFLGIDHTAIAVADTERSLAFYRDRLGFRVAGTSLNSGAEQERLSGVEGARVRITALRREGGPGVELLEYLAPGPGRTSPQPFEANDLAHYRVRVVLGAGRGAPRTLRDPDGHAVEVVDAEAGR